MSRRQDIEATAAAWLARKADGLTDEERHSLDAWLEAALDHRLAFWRLEYGWSKAGRLAALRGPPPRDGARSVLLRWATVTPPRWLLAAAASVVVAVVAVAAWPRPEIYETDLGERQQVVLADGSRLDLNTQTRLRADISGELRQAWLDRGEAYFAIRRDESRPFLLHLGDRTIRVLGTHFTVRREGDAVRVVVSEGRVSLSGDGNSEMGTFVLSAGDVVTIDGASLLHRQQSTEQIDNQLAWRGGLLVFSQATLVEAAAEFNRYNQTQIEVLGADARALRIGGSFEANNVEAFVRLLSIAYDLDVEREEGVIRISQ
ncbi:MAG: FecR domain-containing protein [Caulobacterales bacterium]|nr:FecR domain-containing protein [Caulobacterales bacterium]